MKNKLFEEKNTHMYDNVSQQKQDIDSYSAYAFFQKFSWQILFDILCVVSLPPLSDYVISY